MATQKEIQADIDFFKEVESNGYIDQLRPEEKALYDYYKENGYFDGKQQTPIQVTPEETKRTITEKLATGAQNIPQDFLKRFTDLRYVPEGMAALGKTAAGGIYGLSKAMTPDVIEQGLQKVPGFKQAMAKGDELESYAYANAPNIVTGLKEGFVDPVIHPIDTFEKRPTAILDPALLLATGGGAAATKAGLMAKGGKAANAITAATNVIDPAAAVMTAGRSLAKGGMNTVGQRLPEYLARKSLGIDAKIKDPLVKQLVDTQLQNELKINKNMVSKVRSEISDLETDITNRFGALDPSKTRNVGELLDTAKSLVKDIESKTGVPRTKELASQRQALNDYIKELDTDYGVYKYDPYGVQYRDGYRDLTAKDFHKIKKDAYSLIKTYYDKSKKASNVDVEKMTPADQLTKVKTAEKARQLSIDIANETDTTLAEKLRRQSQLISWKDFADQALARESKKALVPGDVGFYSLLYGPVGAGVATTRRVMNMPQVESSLGKQAYSLRERPALYRDRSRSALLDVLTRNAVNKE